MLVTPTQYLRRQGKSGSLSAKQRSAVYHLLFLSSTDKSVPTTSHKHVVVPIVTVLKLCLIRSLCSLFTVVIVAFQTTLVLGTTISKERCPRCLDPRLSLSDAVDSRIRPVQSVTIHGSNIAQSTCTNLLMGPLTNLFTQKQHWKV